MAVLLLSGSLKHYDWGSRTALATLEGRPPSSRPEAELWFGAHVDGPARVTAALGAEPGLVGGDLARLVSETPERWLGRELAERSRGRLPFLVKLLAAEQPLSLQAHPSEAQAREGFSREEAALVPRTAPERCYRDTSHKPELLIALGPFEALAGFRSAEDCSSWVEELVALGAPTLTALGDELSREPRSVALARALAWGFSLDEDRRRAIVSEVGRAAARVSPSHPRSPAARWLVRLAERHRADAGVLGAALLEQRYLGPGVGLFLGARTLHAYLAGLGLEVMAASDNVLRGGLTTKHVDVSELLRVLDFEAPAPQPVAPRPAASAGALPGEDEWPTSAEEFQVSRLALRGEIEATATGPELWVAIAGAVTVRDGAGDSARVARAGAFLVGAGTPYGLAGAGTLFRVRVPPR